MLRQPLAQQTAAERDGVDHRRGQPAAAQPAQLGVDEPDVEAGVVGDEHGARAEAQEVVEHAVDARLPAQVRGAMPVMRVMMGGMGTPGSTSRSNRATGASADTRTAPISTIRDDPGRVPVVSRSNTT